MGDINIFANSINELYGEKYYIRKVLAYSYTHKQHLTLLINARANGWSVLPQSIELAEYFNKGK